jgi:Mn2+/Fe2+ NRAMP family transporter
VRSGVIVERFGRRWGAFAVGDLLILSALTIVTEFIGVALALGGGDPVRPQRRRPTA